MKDVEPLYTRDEIIRECISVLETNWTHMDPVMRLRALLDEEERLVIKQKNHRRVVKSDGGHRFEGVVVCDFTTMTGKPRCVVEAVDPRFEGLLFILWPEQLEDAP